jgi:hypothetical protein
MPFALRGKGRMHRHEVSKKTRVHEEVLVFSESLWLISYIF